MNSQMNQQIMQKLQELAEKANTNVEKLQEEYNALLARLKNAEIAYRILCTKHRVRKRRAIPVVFTGNQKEPVVEIDCVLPDGRLPSPGDGIALNGQPAGFVIGYTTTTRGAEPAKARVDTHVDLIERFGPAVDASLENVEDGTLVAIAGRIALDFVRDDGTERIAIRRFEKSGNYSIRFLLLQKDDEKPESVYLQLSRPVAEALAIDEDVLRFWQNSNTILMALGLTGTRKFQADDGTEVSIRQLRTYLLRVMIPPSLEDVERFAVPREGYIPLRLLLATGYSREQLEKWAKENNRIGIATIRDTGGEVFDFTPLPESEGSA